MTAWLFPVLSALGVFLAFSLRILLSSRKLGYTKFFLGMIPNMLAMRAHYKIADLNVFPFLGYRPDIIDEHIFIGWLALACFFLHASAFPVKQDLKWWWKR